MNFFRIYANKDNFIDTKKYWLNYGNDHIIDLSITSGSGSSNYTRGLFQFDFGNNITNILTASYTATLTLFNAVNSKFLDSNFNIEIYPILQQWTEGTGDTNFPFSGASNAVSASQLNAWSISGVSYTSSPSASFTFANGTENLTANVSAFIEYWRTQNNYGILVKFPNSIETLTSTYKNNKSFYGRDTETFLKPHIQCLYPSNFIKDDSNNIHLGINNFFFYDRNVTSSAYPGSFIIKDSIVSTSSTAYAGNYFSPYTWYVSFTASQINYDELYLIATNNTNGYSVTSSLTGRLKDTSFYNFNSNQINCNVLVQDEYRNDEVPTFEARVFNYINARMGNRIVSYYPQNVAIKFVERNTRKDATPFLEMNYDKRGYFSQIDLANLQWGFYYFPIIKINDFGNIIYREIPESFFYVRRIS